MRDSDYIKACELAFNEGRKYERFGGKQDRSIGESNDVIMVDMLLGLQRVRKHQEAIREIVDIMFTVSSKYERRDSEVDGE